MSLPCGQIRERFEGYAGERLSLAQRREVRDHLASCGACFDAAGQFDPTLLFSAAALPEVAPEEVAGILSAVRTGIELKESERRLVHPSFGRGPNPRRRRAAVVASAAAVVALTLLLPAGWRRPAESLPREAAVQPPRAASRAPGILPAAGPKEIEQSPTGVTIYDWKPEGPGEPRVVWIYDRSLDI